MKKNGISFVYKQIAALVLFSMLLTLCACGSKSKETDLASEIISSEVLKEDTFLDGGTAQEIQPENNVQDPEIQVEDISIENTEDAAPNWVTATVDKKYYEDGAVIYTKTDVYNTDGILQSSVSYYESVIDGWYETTYESEEDWNMMTGIEYDGDGTIIGEFVCSSYYDIEGYLSSKAFKVNSESRNMESPLSCDYSYDADGNLTHISLWQNGSIGYIDVSYDGEIIRTTEYDDDGYIISVEYVSTNDVRQDRYGFLMPERDIGGIWASFNSPKLWNAFPSDWICLSKTVDSPDGEHFNESYEYDNEWNLTSCRYGQIAYEYNDDGRVLSAYTNFNKDATYYYTYDSDGAVVEVQLIADDNELIEDWSVTYQNTTAESEPAPVLILDNYGDVIDSGKCGYAMNYAYYDSGTLVITGSGTMNNYEEQETPWDEYKDKITSLVITDDVESISSKAFYNCSELTDIEFPNNKITIEINAFDSCPNLNIQVPSNVSFEPADDNNTVFEFNDRVWVEDGNSNVIASTGEDGYDSLYAYGDGFYVFYQYKTGFDENHFIVTVINRNGEVVSEWEDYDCESLMSGALFVWVNGEKGWTIYNNEYKNNPYYCGEGIVVFAHWNNSAGCVADYYNLHTNDVFSIEYGTDRTSFADIKFSQDIPYVCVENGDGEMVILSANGIVGKLNENVRAVGNYSDGGFVYYTSRNGSQLWFFDCVTAESTPICEDSDKVNENSVSSYRFIDGQCTISLTGVDGNTYTAVVDKQGNYIEEPHL